MEEILQDSSEVRRWKKLIGKLFKKLYPDWQKYSYYTPMYFPHNSSDGDIYALRCFCSKTENETVSEKILVCYISVKDLMEIPKFSEGLLDRVEENYNKQLGVPTIEFYFRNKTAGEIFLAEL